MLARYCVAEQAADPATESQHQAARQLIESGQPLFLPKTVALELELELELEWVQRGYYGLTPLQMEGVFAVLLALPSLSLEDRLSLEQALSGHGAGLHVADALHHASCRQGSWFRADGLGGVLLPTAHAHPGTDLD